MSFFPQFHYFSFAFNKILHKLRNFALTFCWHLLIATVFTRFFVLFCFVWRFFSLIYLWCVFIAGIVLILMTAQGTEKKWGTFEISKPFSFFFIWIDMISKTDTHLKCWLHHFEFESYSLSTSIGIYFSLGSQSNSIARIYENSKVSIDSHIKSILFGMVRELNEVESNYFYLDFDLLIPISVAFVEIGDSFFHDQIRKEFWIAAYSFQFKFFEN